MSAKLQKSKFFTCIFQRVWLYDQLDTFTSYWTFSIQLLDLSKQTGEEKEQRNVVQSVFAKIDIIKIKLLVVNSAVTEVNELKNICIAIFRLTF